MGKPTECRMTEPPPNSDQIELTLFGPGFGECIAVHFGEGRWIVVDSCIDKKTGNPAVLDYFNAIGVSPQEVVKLIVISHWHDDHISGLSKIVSSCPQASICCSAALTQKEFLSYALNFQGKIKTSTSSGVDEISQTFQILKNRSFPIKYALSNKTVLKMPATGTADSCIVTALSPSDKEYGNFLREIAAFIPSNKVTKIRASPLRPNNAAVAIWVEIGGIRLLLGSDLEEKHEPSTGWSAIVQSEDRPQGRASVFKIPHHGSITGHHDTVWSDMMIESPIAVLSPFYLAGKMLPTDKDIERIVALTSKSYITMRNPAPKSKVIRPPSVERTIRETVGKMRAVQPPMGCVRLRNGGKSDPDLWNVELFAFGAQLNASNTEKGK
jgi:beta-lactamase superfamily II metal-dependent hydrolase